MKSYPISQINQEARENAKSMILRDEELYYRQILAVAEKLREESRHCSVILLSGPSGSGKTTTARRIEQMLDSWGCEAHTISMDNYFLPHDVGELPRDENGNIDLESPLRLDTALLTEHLIKLSNCEPVDMPVFNFTTQGRTGTIRLNKKKGELILLEGIHALNPAVTGQVDEFATRIYISVRTRLQNEQGALLHPSKIRLTRRLIRDRMTRGYSFSATLKHFRSVSRGENLYIMPYRKFAKFEIDTFMPYEMAAYKHMILTDLETAQSSDEELAELCRFLEELEPVDEALVPTNSLVREFIGGSIFE